MSEAGAMARNSTGGFLLPALFKSKAAIDVSAAATGLQMALLHASAVLRHGPEAGAAGGRIVAEGTPEEVARSRKSVTARYLREALRGGPA